MTSRKRCPIKDLQDRRRSCPAFLQQELPAPGFRLICQWRFCHCCAGRTKLPPLLTMAIRFRNAIYFFPLQRCSRVEACFCSPHLSSADHTSAEALHRSQAPPMFRIEFPRTWFLRVFTEVWFHGPSIRIVFFFARRFHLLSSFC